MDKWLEEYVETTMDMQVKTNGIFKKDLGTDMRWFIFFIVLTCCYAPFFI